MHTRRTVRGRKGETAMSEFIAGVIVGIVVGGIIGLSTMVQVIVGKRGDRHD